MKCFDRTKQAEREAGSRIFLIGWKGDVMDGAAEYKRRLDEGLGGSGCNILQSEGHFRG